jgi:hypothetical protein
MCCPGSKVVQQFLDAWQDLACGEEVGVGFFFLLPFLHGEVELGPVEETLCALGGPLAMGSLGWWEG